MSEEFQRIKFSGQSFIEVLKEIAHNPKEPEFNASKEGPSQEGKVWIVTGSTSGIGFEVACQLAELGAHVWLTGRSEDKAKQHVDLLKQRVGSSANVDYLLLNFADLRSIKPGVAPFLKSGLPLHGVVHNAGVMLTPSTPKTVQGYEMQLGTNDLAPWLLQKLLDPVLLSSTTNKSEGRIVWVSSLAHYCAPYDGAIIAKSPTRIGLHLEAYGQSKAIDSMMSIQWSKLHSGANVKSVAVHPGVIRTNLIRELPTFGAKLFNQIAWPVEYGAASELAAALSDVPDNSYVVPFGRIGHMRSDIRAAAEKDTTLAKWLDVQVNPYA